MRERLPRSSLLSRHARLGRLAGVSLLVAALPSAVGAQDIRGLEVCTAEKQMERRTGCLQANVEYLAQALTKLSRETDEKLAAAARELAAAHAEIGALRSTVEKLNGEMAHMKAKTDAAGKK